jgi:hypothetical protein
VIRFNLLAPEAGIRCVTISLASVLNEGHAIIVSPSRMRNCAIMEGRDYADCARRSRS